MASNSKIPFTSMRTAFKLSCVITGWALLFIISVAKGDVDKLRTQAPITHYDQYIIVSRCIVDGSLRDGTGFIVDDWGKVVTAKHNIASVQESTCNVIVEADSVAINYVCNRSGGQWYWVHNPYTHAKGKDITLIKPDLERPISHYGCQKTRFADEHTVAQVYVGTKVWIPGYDYEKNLVSAVPGYIYGRDWDGEVNDTVWKIEATGLIPGCSGSPVFLAGTDLLIGCVHRSGIAETETTNSGYVKIKKAKSPFHAVRGQVIKNFLQSHCDVTPDEGFEVIQVSPTRVDPPTEQERKLRFGGMLDLIQSSVLDIINRYSQFEENLDTDVLLQTSYEIESFSKKLQKNDCRILDENREQAISFFIKGLAMKAARKNGLFAAVEYFERAVHEDPTFADARYQIALYHLNFTGDYKAAIDQLEKAIDLDPDDGEVLRVLGMYYLYNPVADSAKHFLDRALKPEALGANDPRIQFYLGVYYDPYWAIIKELKKWDSDFTNERGRRPNCHEYQLKRDSLLHNMRYKADNFEKAISYYRRSRELAPGYIRPLNALVWDLANEELDAHYPIHSSTQDTSRHIELKQNLEDLERYVGYGLVDARTFNTIAIGYVALDDCDLAMEYISKSEHILNESHFSPQYRFDLLRENERIERICFCERNWRRIK